MHPNVVGPLNLIDVVFVDSPDVRVAWRHFLEATKEATFSPERLRERYLSIIDKIARDIGLSDKVTIVDIQNSYYPRGLGDMEEAAYLEALDKLQRLRNPGPGPNLTPDL